MATYIDGARIPLFKFPEKWSLTAFAVVQAFILSFALSTIAHAQTAKASESRGTVASVASQNRVQKGTASVEKAPVAPASKPAQETAAPQESDVSIEGPDEQPADDSSQDMNSPLPEGEAQLRVRISVPHQVRPMSMITLYPYPPRPPKQIRNIAKIDDSPKAIRTQLLSLGYSQRSSDTRLFPPAGWRWKYIIKAALEKSGTRHPTNIVTMYPWTFKMVPYVKAEIKRVNDIEADRKARYASAMKDFEENGVDLENEAAQKGLAPIEINLKRGATKLLSGEATVAPGTWYVVAAHKTSNLKFYWQMPISISAGERQTVQLTQTNALVIEGGW